MFAGKVGRDKKKRHKSKHHKKHKHQRKEKSSRKEDRPDDTTLDRGAPVDDAMPEASAPEADELELPEIDP